MDESNRFRMLASHLNDGGGRAHLPGLPIEIARDIDARAGQLSSKEPLQGGIPPEGGGVPSRPDFLG